MTEEQQIEEPQVEGQEPEAAEKPKPKRKRKKSTGPRKPRKPREKDWIRVLKSNGNDLPNTVVHLKLNEATGVAELITNAPKMEGSDEMEGERVQVFRFTSAEVINDPDYNPLAEEPAPEPAPEPEQAPAEAPPDPE